MGAERTDGGRKVVGPIWLSGHCTDDLHRFHADGADAGQEVNDLLLVIGEAVGVELLGDGGITDLVLFPLVEHPFEAAAVAEFVVPGGGGDAVERGGGVNLDGAGFFHGFEAGFEGGFGIGRLFGRAALLRRRAERQLRPTKFGVLLVVTVLPLQWEGRGLLVGEMEVHEGAAQGGPLAEVLVKREAGEFALEVDLVFRPVGRVVEHGVGVVENVELGKLRVAVVLLKLPQAPIGEVVLPVDF